MTSGISAILSGVALLGFFLLVAGIGLAVVAGGQGRSWRGGASLALFGLILGLLFSLASAGVLVVEPTQVAVVYQTISGNLEGPRRAGTHIIVPVFQNAAVYPISQQQFTLSTRDRAGGTQADDSVRARTNDGQEVLVDLTVIYRVNPDDVNTLFTNFRDRYQVDFVQPNVRARARDVVSRFTARQIYGEGRAQVRDQMDQEIGTEFRRFGLELTDLLLRDVTFSEEFTTSIERAQVASQEAEQARIRVQQEQQEAERIRVRADGARDAAIAAAEGEARSIILRAEAEAEALRLVSEQIAANPTLIQYIYVQNLSENVRLALVPSNSPFLFDLSSLAEADPDFVAPTGQTTRDTTTTPQVTPTPTPPGN